VTTTSERQSFKLNSVAAFEPVASPHAGGGDRDQRKRGNNLMHIGSSHHGKPPDIEELSMAPPLDVIDNCCGFCPIIS
jgi:hypothetical protein